MFQGGNGEWCQILYKSNETKNLTIYLKWLIGGICRKFVFDEEIESLVWKMRNEEGKKRKNRNESNAEKWKYGVVEITAMELWRKSWLHSALYGKGVELYVSDFQGLGRRLIW